MRSFPGLVELDKLAAKLIEFLDSNFIRMSCGGLLLDTMKSREHSKTLAGVGPVSDDVGKRYIDSRKEIGYLHRSFSYNDSRRPAMIRYRRSILSKLDEAKNDSSAIFDRSTSTE